KLDFEPGEVVSGSYRFDIGTAGATSLVFQTILLPLALRGAEASEVVITGGTHVKASPCFHFLAPTWAAYLRLLGVRTSISLRRAGFYPRGGGEIHAHIQPSRSVLPVHVPATEVSIAKVTGFNAVAGLPNDIAKRQARRAEFRLKQAQLQAEIRLES